MYNATRLGTDVKARHYGRMGISNEDMTVIKIPIPPEIGEPLVWIASLALLMFVVYKLLPGRAPHSSPIEQVQRRLGLRMLNPGLFLFLVLIWGSMFLVLVAGLMMQIWDVLLAGIPTSETAQRVWRFTLTKLTAMTAVLGAIVAFPVSLVRVKQKQTENFTAADALFNDKINSASADLHAMFVWTKEQTKGEGDFRDFHMPNITRRNAAIDRLEGLVQERPDVAGRVSKLLSVYIRETSREVPPLDMPPGLSPGEIRLWAQNLPVARSDVESAIQVLGRLKEFEQ